MRMIALAAMVLFAFPAFAKGKSVYVKPHVTKKGSYVQPHFRTAPNSTKFDNFSTKGNTNPYTGSSGTKDPFKN